MQPVTLRRIKKGRFAACAIRRFRVSTQFTDVPLGGRHGVDPEGGVVEE